jgi:hypothetical protein
MKVEERQIKAMFITGVVEILTGLFTTWMSWEINFLGYLGYGMIVYSMVLGYYVRNNRRK